MLTNIYVAIWHHQAKMCELIVAKWLHTMSQDLVIIGLWNEVHLSAPLGSNFGKCESEYDKFD